MGNKIGRLKVCFTCDAGEISLRRQDISISLPDEGFGHSFCYFPPESSDEISSFQDVKATMFKSISGASLSANVYTPLSTAPLNLSSESSYSSSDKASSFESSDSFASIPLQPIPRTSVSSFYSGPISADSGTVSVMGLVERGFLSGPIERSFYSDPFDTQFDQSHGFKPKSKKRAFVRNMKKAIANSIIVPIRAAKESDWGNRSSKNNNNKNNNAIENFNLNFSRHEIDGSFVGQNQNEKIQWAQGKAGEDRVHVVISDEHEWVFVGIYDGFNGPDATDFLLVNLYPKVQEELKGLISLNEKMERSELDHRKVLAALGNALRKTEESYLQISDMMLAENPELSLMGSCVLAMLMKGEDVYLMNVGDSRAVLARRAEPEIKPRKDLGRIKEETSYDFEFDLDLSALQLTLDHSTSVQEEVKRIKKEHPDDPCAISNGRVKASLKVTRAFGAGFLKKPKWNNSLLKMFRIDYIGKSPYINCLPSLIHHKLGPSDKFLVLSSDGLYQYFTNEEAIAEIERFLSSFPEGDPAQHLIEEILFRAAKKAGMDFHELLDIPQGDRRRYHDDVSIIIISFEGRTWQSNI